MSTSKANRAAPTRQQLGRYTLLHQLARGGMGGVHLAQMTTPQGFTKWVAVKTIHPHMAQREDLVKAFLDEARLAAWLTHPNVCSVFDFGVEDNNYYLVMEYLHGQPLMAMLQRAASRGGLPPALIARVIADSARGLHAAHEFRLPDGSPGNVVHRDVSPQNIFVLYDGVAKVVDFGIARYSDRLSNETNTGILKGKAAYMSPEQLAADRRTNVDRQTDVFALGVVLWEGLTGQRLFEGETQAQSMMRVLQGEIPPPSTVNPATPAELDPVVLRALARDKSQRYATALEFARDLERFLATRGEVMTATEVGDYVSATFAAERRDREALLHSHTGMHAAVSAEPEAASSRHAAQRGAQSGVHAAPSGQTPVPAPISMAGHESQAGPESTRQRVIGWISAAAALITVVSVATVIGLSVRRSRRENDSVVSGASAPAPGSASTLSVIASAQAVSAAPVTTAIVAPGYPSGAGVYVPTGVAGASAMPTVLVPFIVPSVMPSTSATAPANGGTPAARPRRRRRVPFELL